MKSLDDLKQKQEQVLLAELAGLLHNIGKLDPNFFEPPKAERARRHCFIPQYRFDRFAKPSIELTDKARGIILDKINDWNPEDDKSKEKFESELKPHGLWESSDSADYVQKALDAAWMLVRFQKSNGPLFLCFQNQRTQRYSKIEEEKQNKEKQFQELKQQGVTPPREEAKEIGQKIGELHKEIARLSNLLNEPVVLPEEAIQQQRLEERFRLVLEIVNHKWPLADLLTVFWDDFFFIPIDSVTHEPDYYKRQSALRPWAAKSFSHALHALLILSHGEVSGSEKGGILVAPAFESIRHSTVFGFGPSAPPFWDYSSIRSQIVNAALIACTEPLNERQKFINICRPILETGLGDTRWPVNEITLWDYASSIAALFKSAVAKALLEDRLPTVAEVKWRLLSIRYDGLEYLSRALHISDLLVRRDALEAALNEVKVVIEVEYPLGNEIYRDENGSVLIVPHVEDGDQRIDLLTLPCGDEGALRNVLARKFSQAVYEEDRPALDGEVSPLIALSDEFLGKQIQLPQAAGWNNPPLQPDPSKVAEWWSDESKHSDICAVCGLRPQGYGAPNGKQKLKAQDRSICWVCMERRDERSKNWAQIATRNFQTTIWIDEVADNNGRVALVLGRFVLDGWLDGSLIRTMQKSPSFARIQRCWRTTEIFWKEIERKLRETIGPKFRPRLTIKPRNANSLDLGRYHTYELDIEGARLSIVWDPAAQYFITCENLDYFCKLAAIKPVAELEGKIAQAGSISVYEPSAHLSRRQKLTEFTAAANGAKQYGETGGNCSSPFIHLLSSPAVFMTLVPADRAFNVVKAIKEKYNEEMGKVRDRLPIHVGIVYAPHRTPMRALLEAGRRMLEMPYAWEQWSVESNNHDGNYHNVTFKHSGVMWRIPAVMGDGTTPDQWYPHLMLRKPTSGEDLNDTKPSWKHAKDLQGGDMVYVRPSRFDFEFLDVAGRRNEISYTVDAQTDAWRRRGLPARPFLLEELDTLDNLWDWMVDSKGEGKKKLTTSQLQRLESTLTSYVTEWFSGDLTKATQCKTFQEFTQTVLHRIDPAWWKSLDGEKQDAFNKAMSNGLLLDVLELRMHILKERPEINLN